MAFKSDDAALLKLTLGTLALFSVVCFALWRGVTEKREFMDECVTQKPRFECTALWKASQPDTVTVYTRD